METRLVPYRPWHYMMIMDEAYRWAGVSNHPDPMDTAQSFTKGPAYTLMVDGLVAGCAGVAIMWSGLGEAWAVIGMLGKRHPIPIHRAVARFFPEIALNYKLRRVGATVMNDFGVGKVWAERLGFQFECEMPKYGPRGETFIRYVRYFE